jgi:nucleolin
MFCFAAYDNETGKARGFAHVAFADTQAAAKAIALSGSEFGGRQVYIDSARERGSGGGAGGGAGGTPGTGAGLALTCTVPAWSVREAVQ